MGQLHFVIYLVLSSLLSTSYSQEFNNMESPEFTKRQAFHILTSKCNVCHKKKNKKRVFTLDNMDKYGHRIYKQVFKWKRMPKGNKIKLNILEKDQLKNWIATLPSK